MQSVFTQAAAEPADAFTIVGRFTVRCRQRGFSLVELMVTMTIFLVLMGVAFSAYQAQLRTATREYASASGEMDLLVARNIIVRDLELGGYGLADDYSALSSPPPNIPYVGSNGNPDTLVIRGTSLGLNTRATQGWSYASGTGTFPRWNDASEDLSFDSNVLRSDSVIQLEPTSRRLLTFVSGGTTYWRFSYGDSTTTPPWTLTAVPPDPDDPDDPSDTTDGISAVAATTPATGTLLYGLTKAGKQATQPYWAVRYYLANSTVGTDRCAVGAKRHLLRAESLVEHTNPDSGDAIATCVLDFQVAFGLDRDENGSIDTLWDNGGAELNTNSWTNVEVKKRLKQVRVYMLVQSGGLDPDGYTYPSATVRVGDAVGGRDLTLTAAQRRYRWKLLTVSVTPRNMR